MNSIDKKELSEQVKKVIDDAYVSRSITAGFRSHLGASVIGHECARYIWYQFRWFKFERFSGRMLRLFERGHFEEARIRRQLREIGCRFIDKIDETGEQPTMSNIDGHFGGSCDGIFMWPEPMGIDEPFLLECKTKATGNGFNDLSAKGLEQANPQHYRQMQVYLMGLRLRYGLYVSVNKNDDTLYTEIVESDHKTSDLMLRKAELIFAQEPPHRISERRNYYKCNQCSMQGICHDGETPVPNCRNCKNSKPTVDAKWYCNHWNNVIPSEWLIKGCEEHVSL